MEPALTLSKFIDHTLLKPEVTSDQIMQHCQEAVDHQFFAVCVNSSYVSLCSQHLKNSSVKIATVIGFPLGNMDTASKYFETATAIKNGAHEIDMVIHIGALKERNYAYVENDIAEVVRAAAGNKVKVIIETSLLTDDEKKKASELSLKAQAHFVKTCTGFSGGGATVADIKLIKSIVGSKMEIKASGGIKTYTSAVELISVGATRLGTSAGIALIKHQTVQPGSY